MSKHPYQILDRPLLTERATDRQTMARPQYTFKVAVDSNKVEIRRAIEQAFNVRVVGVNTIMVKGKRKRLRTAKLGRRPDWKKAIVTLAEGDSINLI
ncbi:MAG TPA: 50S ribosomal protein L23 [Candidatus Sumerlaeota bacterium]|nr:50S ribosomal protein L23 [Candidatus Sumerlaeota bacterium]